MGRTKDLFITERERQMAENDCDGNCLECCRTCEVTQRDIEENIRMFNEDADYE